MLYNFNYKLVKIQNTSLINLYENNILPFILNIIVLYK